MAHLIRKKVRQQTYLYIQEIKILDYLGNEKQYSDKAMEELKRILKEVKTPRALGFVLTKFKSKYRGKKDDD